MRRILLAAFICCSLAIPATAYELGGWDVHGTFSQGWIHSRDNNFIEDSTSGTFEFREFGLNASTLVAERITVGGQVFGRKYGSIGDDELYLDWLSATYSLNDQVGFRLGKLKMPYGMHGATRDIDSLRTQILLPQSVYLESFRGSLNAMWGGAVFGRLESGVWGSLDYSLQAGRSDIDEDSGELNRLASYIQLEVDKADDSDAGALELIWNTPARGLRLGATLSWAEFSAGGPTDRTLGLDGRFSTEVQDQYFLITSAEYSRHRTTFTFEYLYAANEMSVVLDAVPTGPLVLDVTLTGYYMNLDYRATDELTFALGYNAMSVKQEVSATLLSTRIKDGQNGYYASLRYNITPNLIAKIEQHFSEGEAGLFASENPDGLQDDWSMTLLKLSFVF